MIAVTLKSAKARLDDLVQRAIGGERVVLTRGSRRVASIVPLSAAHSQASPRLTNAQAGRLLDRIRADRLEGRMRRFSTPRQAVEVLRREIKARLGRPPRRAK